MIYHKGHVIILEHDLYPPPPTDWHDDSCATIRMRPNRHFAPRKYTSPSHMRDDLIPESAIQLPLYMYVHSEVRLSLEPFSCPWDSGRAGTVYAESHESAKNLIDQWNTYLSGDVWTYRVLDCLGNEIDSCGGIYGQDHALSEAKSFIDSL